MNRAIWIGLVFAIVCPFACTSSSSNNGGGGDDSSSPVCGDNVCDVSEINTCPADCGTRTSMGSGSATMCNFDGICESADGENPITCPADCPAGSGSNQGSGSAAVDCSDPQVVADCTMCAETFGSDCGTTGLANCLSCIGL